MASPAKSDLERQLAFTVKDPFHILLSLLPTQSPLVHSSPSFQEIISPFVNNLPGCLLCACDVQRRPP